MSFARASGPGVLLDLKVVPGARRDEVAGVLGDRLKVRVSAAPEGGRANDAVRALLARELRVDERAVVIVQGPTGPLKTVHVQGVSVDAVEARWSGQGERR